MDELSLEKELLENKMVVTQISGKSMQPFLYDGDTVLISSNIEYKVLDVCLIKIGKQYLLHRLISIEGDKYIFKGDDNLNKEIVKKENILGVLIFYYKDDECIEITNLTNKKYYLLSIIKKPYLYLKNKLKPEPKYFVIKIAGLFIKIYYKYDYIYNMCEEYIVDSFDHIDINISYTTNEIKSISDKGTEEFKEYILVHEKIAKQLYKHHRILFHGAAIAYNGNAYIFTGQSGIGKSTHIKLLKDNFSNITIINGDKPILDDLGNVYGTPWSGKENWNENVSYPLKAIVFVNRDNHNHIEKISTKERLNKLLDELYKGNNIDEIIDILNSSLNNVEFFDLYCLNNVDAAKLTFKTIIKK